MKELKSLQLVQQFIIKQLKHLLLPCLILLLSACATAPTPVSLSSDYDWNNHSSNISKLNWQIQGKIAFFSDKKRQSANIFWQQQNRNFQIKLTSFIGTSILDIEGDDQFIKLTADDKVYYNHQARQIMRQVTGLAMPINNVADWLTLNLPANQLDFSAKGLPLNYQPNNREQWQVNYQNFIWVKQFQLPSELNLTMPKGRIKLKLNNWKLGEA